VGIIDRDYSCGAPNHGAVLYNEVRSALYDLEERPQVLSFICGLGGREVTLDSVTEMSEILLKTAQTRRIEQPTYWIGVRG
jgi:pyruvate ferredoxin oxidoreductase alpha subunit